MPFLMSSAQIWLKALLTARNVRSDVEKLILVLKMAFASICGQNCSNISEAINLDNKRVTVTIFRHTKPSVCMVNCDRWDWQLKQFWDEGFKNV